MGVQNTHIYACKTRLYLRTRNTHISAYQGTACLIGGHYQFDAKDFDQKAGMVSYCKILPIKVKNIR